MARRTRSLVSSLIDGLFLQVLETVEGDTPASAATSLIVTAIKLPPVDYVEKISASVSANENIVVHNCKPVKHIA